MSTFVQRAVVAAIVLATCSTFVVAQLPAPTRVYSNAFHVTALNQNDGLVADTQVGALKVVTNGIVKHGAGTGQIDGFDTWEGDGQGVATDFVGLGYDSPARFDHLTIELGNQFVDGGDWQEEPQVYVLKNPVMNSESVRPEKSPNWVRVPATVVGSGADLPHAFDGTVVQGPGGTIHLQLSGTDDERTGWGWAVGGVDGNEREDGIFNFISVTELLAEGAAASAPVIIAPTTPQPMNVVSNAYHSPNHSATDFTDGLRGEVFEAITNGEVTPGGPDGFDSWDGDSQGRRSDFVGLQYNSLVEFDTIKIDLGSQFADGGDWQETPKVYVLKNPVDTNRVRPELDSNWIEVPAVETTGHVYDGLVSPGDGGTMEFKLTGPAAERTGWAWAVGGVDGNQSDTGMFNFVSISEVSATGSVVANVLVGDFNQDGHLGVEDLDLLAIAQVDHNAEYDLTGDNATDIADREFWVHELDHTWMGDANLDGKFDSDDFVVVFIAGHYETADLIGWADGDWNGDRIFDASDFVAAFIDGGYEQGVRPAAAAVPEPVGSAWLFWLGLIAWRRQRVRSIVA